MFAQQPKNETFSFMTDNILFVAELVSWLHCLFYVHGQIEHFSQTHFPTLCDVKHGST